MKKTLLLTAMLGIMTVGSAFALPINDRPGDVIPGAPSDNSEYTLQQILDTYVTPPTGAPAYNAVTSQSQQALWNSTDAGSRSFLIDLFSAHDNGVFGIYSQTAQYDLINRQANPAATSRGFSITDAGNLVDSEDNLLVANFGKTFGFYWRDVNHSDPAYIAYTEDSKNTSGGLNVRALTYMLTDGTVVSRELPDGTRTTSTMEGGNDWLMAFEDHPDGDYDYNDAVFMVKDISPVPEPGTMLLLGAGFLALAIYGKRRKNV